MQPHAGPAICALYTMPSTGNSSPTRLNEPSSIPTGDGSQTSNGRIPVVRYLRNSLSSLAEPERSATMAMSRRTIIVVASADTTVESMPNTRAKYTCSAPFVGPCCSRTAMCTTSGKVAVGVKLHVPGKRVPLVGLRAPPGARRRLCVASTPSMHRSPRRQTFSAPRGPGILCAWPLRPRGRRWQVRLPFLHVVPRRVAPGTVNRQLFGLALERCDDHG